MAWLTTTETTATSTPCVTAAVPTLRASQEVAKSVSSICIVGIPQTPYASPNCTSEDWMSRLNTERTRRPPKITGYSKT